MESWSWKASSNTCNATFRMDSDFASQPIQTWPCNPCPVVKPNAGRRSREEVFPGSVAADQSWLMIIDNDTCVVAIPGY